MKKINKIKFKFRLIIIVLFNNKNNFFKKITNKIFLFKIFNKIKIIKHLKFIINNN